MMSNVYMYFLYALSIFLFLNSTNMFMFWILMEFNLICFILLIYFMGSFFFKEESFMMGIYYFMLQSMGSLIFLFSIFLKDMTLHYCDIMFICSLMIKMGLFPFFFWVYKLGACTKPIITFFILTLQKIPLFLVLFSNFLDSIPYFILFSFIFGSFLIYMSSSYIDVFISSSISSSFWVYMIFLDNLLTFFLFFFFYTLILFMFFSSESLINFNIFSSFEFLLMVGTFLFLVGLPPFSLFFFKFYLSSFMSFFFSKLEFLVFWLFSFVTLLGYTKFFFFTFFLSKNLYLKNDFQIKKMSYFYLHPFFFLFFVMC